MTQYARPNADVADAEWSDASGFTTDLWDSIEESSADDNDFITSSYDGMTTPGWCKIGLGNTVTDPVTALSDHKIKYRALGTDSMMIGNVPPLIVSLYEGTTEIATVTNSSLTGSFANYTLSLDSTQAGNIGTYNNLELWFKAVFDTAEMGDDVQVSQAWFECADVPAVGATTSPAFLLFME